MSADTPMTISEACAVTDQFGHFLKGMARLQEASAVLRGADQLVSERKSQAATLGTQIESLQKLLGELEIAKAAASDAAKATREGAMAEAKRILEDARGAARKLTDDAQERAVAATNDMNLAIARAAAEEARLIQLQKDVASTEARLAEVKESARRAFGG